MQLFQEKTYIFVNIQLINMLYNIFITFNPSKMVINMSDKKNFIPDDDYEYEKELADQAKHEREEAEAKRLESLEQQKKREKQAQARREERLRAEKVELMKLKNGVISESDTIKEEHEQIRELHGIEKLKNFIYHYKFLLIFFAFIIIAAVYILVSTLTKVKPDLTVMMIANNGLSYRQEELETFFEKYTEDLNGDGKVYVSVITAPLSNGSTDQMMLSNQTKFFGTIQSGDCMLFITDSNTDDDIMEIMEHDLSKNFPGNKYITEKGLSLNMKLFANEIKFENMPKDVVLSIRQPTKTINTSEEEMKKRYEKAFKTFSAIADDLSKKAEESNDPGLTTEPLKKEDSSSAQ